MKWRNSKERELLSSGGSRESTLPTKSDLNGELPDGEDPQKPKDLGDDLDQLLAEDDDITEPPSGSSHELTMPETGSTQPPLPEASHVSPYDPNAQMAHEELLHPMSHYSDSDDEEEEIDVS